MEDNKKKKKSYTAAMEMDSFFDIACENNEEMTTSSAEIHGLSSLLDISKLDEENVDWETMGSFVPVGPNDKTHKQKEMVNPQNLYSGGSFAHYEIREKLGAGGMGIVYKAFDTKLEREVALKISFNGNNPEEKDFKRFQQEAKALAQLDHPNIVKLHEVGHEPQSYFAMEYIKGTTLKALIHKEDLTNRRIALIMKEIALAVDEAHKKGIIHRDLKPSNIIIDSHGKVKILDFGIAKLVNKPQDISKTGDLLGTLHYMSPEQAKNDAVDFRTDIYSLGATLFEVLTKRPPFEGDSHLSVYYQIVDMEPVAPNRLNSKVPTELTAICLKCLEKNAHKRYRNAYELAQDFDNYLEHRPIIAKTPTTFDSAMKFLIRNRAICTMVAAFLLITSLAIGYVFSATDTLQNELSQKNKELAATNDAIAEKDELIQSQDENLKVKEHIIATKDQVISSKENALSSKQNTISSKDKELNHTTKKISDLNQEIKTVKEQIERMSQLQLEENNDAEFTTVESDSKNETEENTSTTVTEEKRVNEQIAQNTPNNTTKENKNTRNIRNGNGNNRNDNGSQVPDNGNQNPNPTPDPTNPNPNPNPDTPQNPLLVSAGTLANTLPKGGKNNFPIKADVSTSALSVDGSSFLLGYNDGNFVIGETKTEKRHTLRHGSKVLSIAMKGDFVLTGAEDGTVKLWDSSILKKDVKPGKFFDSSTVEPLFTLNEHFDAIEYVVFDSQQEVFYTGSKSKSLRTWSMQGELLQNTFVMNPIFAQQFIESVEEVKFISHQFDFANRQIVAVTFFANKISIWKGNLEEESLTKTNKINISNLNNVSGIAICARNEMIMVGHEDGKIMLLQIDTSRANALDKHKSNIKTIAFSEKGNIVISASIDDVELWKYNEK